MRREVFGAFSIATSLVSLAAVSPVTIRTLGPLR